MKKLTFISLTLVSLLISSHAGALEARIPTTSMSKALEIVQSKDNFSTLKNVKFNVKEKLYNITYINKSGVANTIKISQLNGKEVK